MEHPLFHGGYSTVLRESYDGSAAITDARGRVIMCSGFPLHLGCYSRAVRATTALYPGQRMRPGDSFIANASVSGPTPAAPGPIAAVRATGGSTRWTSR